MFKFLARIDKSYWLLAIVQMITSWSWLSYRVRPFVPVVLIIVWWIVSDKRVVPIPGAMRLSRAFCRVFISWFLFTFINSIYAIFGHGEITKYYIMATALGAFSSFVVYHCSFRTGKYREIIFLFGISLLCILLNCVSSFRASGIEGFEGARVLTTDLTKHATEDNFYNAYMARSLGVSGYGAMYSYALSLPALIWGFMSIKKVGLRFVFLSSIFAIIYIVRSGGLGTPIMVALFGIILYLSSFKMRPRAILILGLLGSVALLVFAYKPGVFGFLAKPIELLRLIFEEGSSIDVRLESIVDGLKGDVGSYAVERYQLQAKSFEEFLKNPFVGLGLYYYPHPVVRMIGGHSMLLDFMAMSGVVGLTIFAFLISSVINYYKCLTYSFNLDKRLNAVVIIFLCAFIFTCVANPYPTIPASLYHTAAIAVLINYSRWIGRKERFYGRWNQGF